MKIAAVIVHYGDPQVTIRTLESIRAPQGVEILPVVVDHGPGQGRHLQEAARDLGATALRPEWNSGFAGGLNAGIREIRSRGGADLYLLLNHDVVLGANTAQVLAGRFAEEPALGVAGPVLLESSLNASESRRVWNAGSEVDWPSARPRSLYHGHPLEDLPREPYPAGFVCGCAAMVRGSLLDQMGLLNEEYFLYFEDAELSFRARESGYKVEVDPRAPAVHFPGSAVDGLPGLAAYCRTRNRILFSRRWAPAGVMPHIERWRFAMKRMARGGPERRGAVAGLLGKSGPPPEDLLAGTPDA